MEFVLTQIARAFISGIVALVVLTGIIPAAIYCLWMRENPFEYFQIWLLPDLEKNDAPIPTVHWTDRSFRSGR